MEAKHKDLVRGGGQTEGSGIQNNVKILITATSNLRGLSLNEIIIVQCPCQVTVWCLNIFDVLPHAVSLFLQIICFVARSFWRQS